MKKAFDLAWKHGILYTLHKWGIRGNLAYFIEGFLKQRSSVVRLGPLLSDSFTQENGVPQGSVLSTTLFNVLINGVSEVIHLPVKHIIFADDLAIFLPCTDVKIGQEILQSTVDKIHSWSNLNSFVISPEKTTAIHFCRRRGCNHGLDISINNRHIPRLNTVRYLGLLLDEKLSWKEHIASLKKSSMKKLNLMKKLAHSSYGADTTTLMKIYRSVVRSKLDYGAAAYSNARNSVLNSLNSIHHAGIRLTLGAFQTSPTISLLHNASEWSLSLRRRYLTINSLTHTATVPNLPLSIKYDNLADRWNHVPLTQRTLSALSSIDLHLPNLLLLEVNPFPPWEKNSLKVDLTLTSFDKKITPRHIVHTAYKQMLSRYPNSSCLYTDGSRSDTGVGCAVVSGSCILAQCSLPSHFSIFSAELYAIKTAAESVKQHTDNYLILSNSLSSLSALLELNSSSSTKRHPLVCQIGALVMASTSHIVFVWIPSHVGIPENDLADAAAKEASVLFPLPNSAVPSSDFKNLVKIHLNQCLEQHLGGTVLNK